MKMKTIKLYSMKDIATDIPEYQNIARLVSGNGYMEYVVCTYTAGDSRAPINNWFIENGAKIGEKVLIKY
jgi:hypothetical protein